MTMQVNVEEPKKAKAALDAAATFLAGAGRGEQSQIVMDMVKQIATHLKNERYDWLAKVESTLNESEFVEFIQAFPELKSEIEAMRMDRGV